VVAPGSAAEKAGLKVGDRIVRIGERSIDTTADFAPAVRVQPSGRSVAFSLVRSGAPITLDIIMAEAPREHGAGLVTAYGAVDVGGELHRTLLTRPAGATRGGKPAAVLILGGIGCYSVDVATDEHDAYRQLRRISPAVASYHSELKRAEWGIARAVPASAPTLARRALCMNPHYRLCSANVAWIGRGSTFSATASEASSRQALLRDIRWLA
jgi:hypothetical protein